MPATRFDQQRRHWVSLAAARIEVAKRKFGDPKQSEVGTGEHSEIIDGYSREQIKKANDELYQALLNREIVAHWRERSLDPRRTPIDANDFEDSRVWNLVILANRPLRGVVNPAIAGLWNKIIELPCDELGQWLDKRFPNPGGRLTIVDWEIVENEVRRLMDKNGEFMQINPSWNCRARLEETLMQFCFERFNLEPGKTTLQRNLKPMLEKWRSDRHQS